jgi:hypothetical protein
MEPNDTVSVSSAGLVPASPLAGARLKKKSQGYPLGLLFLQDETFTADPPILLKGAIASFDNGAA